VSHSISPNTSPEKLTVIKRERDVFRSVDRLQSDRVYDSGGEPLIGGPDILTGTTLSTARAGLSYVRKVSLILQDLLLASLFRLTG
jgi:hypothetical protein